MLKIRLSLIFILQNGITVMGHDGPTRPFDIKFAFENVFVN